jgi:hypothetical protein
MCGACAVLSGGPDWIDRVGNPDGVGHSESLTRGAERQRRVMLVNLLLRPKRMRLFDLGNSLSLGGPTGGVEIVESLSHVWAAADRMSSSLVDPLDLGQLEDIERAIAESYEYTKSR